jgi:hypothetical protein
LQVLGSHHHLLFLALHGNLLEASINQSTWGFDALELYTSFFLSVDVIILGVLLFFFFFAFLGICFEILLFLQVATGCTHLPSMGMEL